MNALIKLAIATFLGIALTSPSTASDRGTKPEAVAMEPVGDMGFAVGIYKP